MWALPGPHLGSSSPARRASSPTRRRRPPSRPSRRRSRRALRGIRPSGAGRLYADRAFLIPASRGPRSFASAALAERAETLDFAMQGAGFETRPPFLPFWARFCRYFWLFLAISGYFWVGCVPRWAECTMRGGLGAPWGAWRAGPGGVSAGKMRPRGVFCHPKAPTQPPGCPRERATTCRPTLPSRARSTRDPRSWSASREGGCSPWPRTNARHLFY